MAIEGATAACYDESYKKKNYFRHRKWLYAPYISSLIAFLGLEEGSSVLDVGCGQGFFCDLFGKHGMKVHGIDISGMGYAQRKRCTVDRELPLRFRTSGQRDSPNNLIASLYGHAPSTIQTPFHPKGM